MPYSGFDRSNYCSHCGALLRAGSGRKRIILTVVLAAAVAGFFSIYLLLRLPEGVNTQRSVRPEKRSAAVESSSRRLLKHAGAPSYQPSGRSDEIKLLIGDIVLKDIAGKTMSLSQAAVADGGWIAVPRQRSLGAYEWILRVDPNRHLTLFEGVLGDMDDIGLWRIEPEQVLPGPQISAWQSDRSVSWHSLTDSSPRTRIEVTIDNEQRWFTRALLSEPLTEDGVFVQHNSVVGWSFAELPNHAFMWRGPPGSQIVPDFRVDDYYRLTFAGGREEEFILALAMGPDYSETEHLAALANAFAAEPRLPRKNVPPQLKSTRIVQRMRMLIDSLLKQDLVDGVANAFDAAILSAAADTDLTTAVASATLRAYGHQDAVLLVEDVADRWITGDTAAFNRLSGLRSQLYQDWVGSLLKQEDLVRARQIFERAQNSLPQDPQIAMLGVRLALRENDWAEAERIIQGRLFPAEMADQIRLAQMRISEIKSQENKIVIRFAPGSKHIPVTAALNDTLEQQFVVDTGATTVTIPTSAARKLGFSSLDRFPLRTVYTAGGMRQAPEIILPSITIDGWQVREVRALVLDLPGQSDLGLLGLNFLNRFQLDLNSDRGVLLLNPR